MKLDKIYFEIQNYIDKTGEDYRYQDKEHPIKALQNRKVDNTSVGVRA